MPDSSCLAMPADRARPATEKLRSMLGSVWPDARHVVWSTVPVPAEGAGGWANGAVLRPGPLDAPRYREPHVIVVVCADGETHTSADYKTGKNAVILSRC